MAKNAFMSPVQPDEFLSKIVGPTPIPRTEIVKKFWEYVKKNNLQDPKNKRDIIANGELHPVFGKKKINMMEVPKVIAKHVTKVK